MQTYFEKSSRSGNKGEELTRSYNLTRIEKEAIKHCIVTDSSIAYEKEKKMPILKKVKIAYRTALQTTILAVIREAKLWEKYGMEPMMFQIEGTQDAERALLEGKVDVVIGNHATPYLSRFQGAKVVYLAQTVNWTNEKLMTVPGITCLDDLKGKRIGTSAIGQHPELTSRLRLQGVGLDPQKSNITMVPVHNTSQQKRLESVIDGTADASFVTPPYDVKGKRAGLKVLDVPPIPMIWGVTLTSTTPFIEADYERAMALVKGLVAGIAYFKTHRKETLKILEEHVASSLGLEDQELLEQLYNDFRDSLEKKPYPHPLAVHNVFRLVLMDHPELEGMNPWELWDTHILRILDDSGFIQSLYS